MDISSVPEYSRLEIFDPMAMAMDRPDVERITAPVRSMVIQALRIQSYLDVLRRRQAEAESLRSTIAFNTARQIKSLLQQVPRDIAPIACAHDDRIALLMEAASLEDPSRFLGLIAGLVHEQTLCVADLPWVPQTEDLHNDYYDILQEYRDARASSSVARKLKYLDQTFSRKLIPRMSTDVAYFQSVSMLLSYMHIEVPQREISIPINLKCTTMFNSEDARRILRCKRFVLRGWFMQSGGEYSGVKIRIWEAVDGDGRGGEVFMLDCMGTSSVSRVRDAKHKHTKVVTGSLADVDPKGIVATAFADMREPIVRRLKELIPKDALVVCTGHSLGATTAHRCYAALHELGYLGAYLMGYNGGAFADPIPDELARHASVHAHFVLNKHDPVPFGGKYLLPGYVKTNEIHYGGTIASANPLFGAFKDPIVHGNAEEVAAAYLGLPARYKSVHSTSPHQWLIHYINQAVLSWTTKIHHSVITTVLKPEADEEERRAVSWFSKPGAGITK